MALAPKVVPVWAKQLAVKQDEHEVRLSTLETVYEDISDIRKFTGKIWAAIKWGAPTVIASAVTAGYINGDFAILLQAIFH